jgi:hypothetical protein
LSMNVILLLTAELCIPFTVNALQAVQQLLITVVPGSTLSLIISINVSAVWLLTMTKNVFPIIYSTPPNTKSPFTWWPLLYFSLVKLLSCTLTNVHPTPIFRYAFYILQHNYPAKQKPVTSSSVQYLVLHVRFSCNTA